VPGEDGVVLRVRVRGEPRATSERMSMHGSGLVAPRATVSRHGVTGRARGYAMRLTIPMKARRPIGSLEVTVSSSFRALSRCAQPDDDGRPNLTRVWEED
jgi:hypothetical protein